MAASMEKRIVSSENIQPSSPTPVDKRSHKLSLLDQIILPLYTPIVVYFPAPPSINNHKSKSSSSLFDLDRFVNETTATLKQSLSATLTQFYPLAGRTKGTSSSPSIDCNDQGVLFIISRIKGTLEQLLTDPDPAQGIAHLPCGELIWAEPSPCSHVAMIQVNYFDCGAIAIGSLFLHTVIDGAIMVEFLKTWAANANANVGISPVKTEYPDYKPRSFFPGNESIQVGMSCSTRMRQYLRTGKVITRRYVFDSSAFSTLRSRVQEDLGYVSRVELVSAILWKCFLVANSSKHSLLTHAVNLRNKAKPPYPKHSFGNFIWDMPVVSSTDHDDDTDIRVFIRRMRASVSKIDGDFLKRMQGDDDAVSGYAKNLELLWDGFPENGHELLSMISWCNFGIYEIDFGFGKPVWASRCDSGSEKVTQFCDSVWLMDTTDGGGVEAWVTLDESYIEKFDAVEELQALALVDPSPLEINRPFK